MRVKGVVYTPAPSEEVASASIPLTYQQVQELGPPGEGDMIMGLRTSDPLMQEVVCVTDLPPCCQDPFHLGIAHFAEVEEALAEYKRKHSA